MASIVISILIDSIANYIQILRNIYTAPRCELAAAMSVARVAVRSARLCVWGAYRSHRYSKTPRAAITTLVWRKYG
jgi:hypothetical protein